MIRLLPTEYGSIVPHAVKPGSEEFVAAAEARYDRVMRFVVFLGVIFSVMVTAVGLWSTFTFLSPSAPADRVPILFATLGSLALGGLAFTAVYFLSRLGARESLAERIKDHARGDYALFQMYQSGEASAEQEWRAAELVTKSRSLDRERWDLDSKVFDLRELRLSTAREMEVQGMEREIKKLQKRSQSLLQEAAELLDPPVRRRYKKAAVLG